MSDHTTVVIWIMKIFFCIVLLCMLGFPDSSVGKESACNAGDPSSIPGSGRSAGEQIGYPLQYSGLENSLDSIVHGVAKSQTRLSDFHFHFNILYHLVAVLPKLHNMLR